MKADTLGPASGQTAQRPPIPQPKRDGRFRQLVDQAGGGDPEAWADLWKEYGFDLAREEQP